MVKRFSSDRAFLAQRDFASRWHFVRRSSVITLVRVRGHRLCAVSSPLPICLCGMRTHLINCRRIRGDGVNGGASASIAQSREQVRDVFFRITKYILIINGVSRNAAHANH